jgi:hypothetical protein
VQRRRGQREGVHLGDVVEKITVPFLASIADRVSDTFDDLGSPADR